MSKKQPRRTFNCSCMNANVTQNFWSERQQQKPMQRTAVIASVCQCNDSMKKWWIRFDPIQSLSESDAVDMFNVNYDTRIGTVELDGQFGMFLPWQDYHFRFKELFKAGDDGHTPDEDLADAMDLARAVAKSNEIEELRSAAPDNGVGELGTQRL